MADHNFFNQSGQYGSALRSSLTAFENGIANLNLVFNTMNEMLEGDGTVDAHYSTITNRYGFVDDAKSRAAYDDINAALGKVNTDASVSNTQAALRQLFDRLR